MLSAASNYLFGGKAADKEENADPEKAMQEALNSHGDFAMDTSGVLTFEDTLILRSIVIRQGNRAFMPIREKL